ncbi:MAG: HIT family protein [Bdellovibrionales bacterium]|nr:HIT family protein [Bdellovibrionales bacterium]
MADTIFSQILQGTAPGSFIYRGARVSAFLDVQGILPGHCLVVPHDPVSSAEELEDSLARELFSVAISIAKGCRQGIVSCEGVNIWLSDGKAAGQEVEHLHVHVVPRRTGDTFKVDYQADPWCESRRPELDKFARQIKSELDLRECFAERSQK